MDTTIRTASMWDLIWKYNYTVPPLLTSYKQDDFIE